MGATASPVQDLLNEATRLLEHPPEPGQTWEERVGRIKAISHELDKHGVDGASVIRFGMRELFAVPVVGSVVASVLLESHGEEPSTDVASIDVAGWRTALGLAADELRSAADLAEVVGHTVHMIDGWVAFAPVEELVRMSPPPREQLVSWATHVDSDTDAASHVYRWLVVRTLEPDLKQWSTQSLKHEYGYAVQGEPPPLPESLLAVAAVDPDRLAHALAARTLRDDADYQKLEMSALLDGVRKQAKMLVRQGRCVEAAALFEFLISRYPGVSDLRNNLGFCLVTSRPGIAAEHFRDAQRMGFTPMSLLLYNRACCVTTESLKREVLFDANRHWLDSLERAPVPAFVWKYDDAEVAPADTPDVRVDLASASAGIARDLGELDRVADWESRIAKLDAASQMHTSSPRPGP